MRRRHGATVAAKDQPAKQRRRLAAGAVGANPRAHRQQRVISSAIDRMPDLIGRAGNALKLGSDIADPLADWWSKMQREALNSVIENVRGFGVALEEIAKILKARRGVLQDALPAKDTPRDPDVLRAEAEVERMLKAGIEIPDDLARIVEKIDVRGSKVAPVRVPRWRDIARFSSLRELRASGTDFEISKDGGYLAVLTSLSLLWFPLTQTNDLTPLGQLTALTSLSVTGNSATDLTPLGRLTALTSLTVHASSATDLTPLGRLTALTSLLVDARGEFDLVWLDALKQLKKVGLKGVKVLNRAVLQGVELQIYS